ncbi:MAG: UDP-N-acetylmuramoyl-L-alanine--D-glutamate ligase [Nitrospirae bacterium]|nr:UDP-N-acetylmuramoyl-L-alanine--D-glutamate ligase [Nitrospirota bacterium]
MEKQEMTFKGKNIVVVGLARSGTGAANLLSALGAEVTITDSKSRSALEAHIKRLLPSVNILTGDDPDEIIDSADMIIISPGVPLKSHVPERARIKGIPVIGELELAYQAIKQMGQGAWVKGHGSPGPLPLAPCPFFIGITGTNGKSTTTMLVDLMLKEAGFGTLLGGNIGIALSEEILKAGARVMGQGSGESPRPLPLDYIVAEISSFQLETINEFRPKIAAVLNITPDHLDRYENMEEYIEAKARIFENQTHDDFLVLNADDVLEKVRTEKLKVRSKKLPKILYFSRMKEVEGVYLKDGMIYCNSSHFQLPTSHFPLISQNEIKIQGVHNIENAMAAALVALSAGCPPDAIANVLKSFPGLEHRLEFAGEVGGVRFINDSKGTNIGAVFKSLEGLDDVILIMGGLDKGSDFSVLRDLVRRKVKALVLIGKAKDKIEEALGGVTETLIAGDLQAAVDLSMAKASPGDVVLLSPGCASFDMFKDFEDRGRKFKEAVKLVQESRVKS